MADADFFDAKMAGWWMWGQSAWIGSGWCSGRGPWIVGADGRIQKRPKSGGVHRKLPHLGNDGRGVNHANAREEGVHRKLPHIADDGRGVARPQLREEGVARQLPHLGSDGQGVARPQLREEGVARQLPHLGNDGQGVNQPRTREEGVGEPEYHPMTMPELRRWMRFLSARLRHVRICNGDWSRVTTTGALQTIGVRQGAHCGVFLDPPYASDVRTADLYAHDSADLAAQVREWCIEHGSNPRFRIVLAGFDTEHEALEELGWIAVEWYRSGFLKGGMSKQSDRGTQQHRERLWLSPACIRPRVEAPRQRALFEAVDGG